MADSDESETVKAAARIVTNAMLQAGMEPQRAIDHPVVRGIVQKWLLGEWTQEEVVDACRDLLLMYPDLRIDPRLVHNCGPPRISTLTATATMSGF